MVRSVESIAKITRFLFIERIHALLKHITH